MSEGASLSSLDIDSSLLHDIGEVMEVGTLTVDADLVVRGWNRWLEAASGLSAADVVGRSLLELFPDLAGSQREWAFRRALAGGTMVLAHRLHRYLLPLPPRVGAGGFELMQQSARIIPILSDDLTVRGAAAFIQDVTDRVAREDDLRAAIQRAETASQAKSEFLAAMSHELRTPLSAVVGYAELLAMGLSGPVLPAQRDHLDRIKSCSWHLLKIVEEILSFARTEAGKEPIDFIEADAGEIVREAVVLLEPQAIQKGLRIQVTLAEVPIRLDTDPTKVRQILVNLLGNAIKFTDSRLISVETTDEGDLVQFCVRDTGPGIPDEERERIFEAFTQLDQSRTRVKGGTGLGLPVSRNLARLLGGDLKVDSQPGGGSAFRVWVAKHGQVNGAAPHRTPPAGTRGYGLSEAVDGGQRSPG